MRGTGHVLLGSIGFFFFRGKLSLGNESFSPGMRSVSSEAGGVQSG